MFVPSNILCMQAIAQSDFFRLAIQSKSNTKKGLKIQIQIHFSNWIDNLIAIQLLDKK